MSRNLLRKVVNFFQGKSNNVEKVGTIETQVQSVSVEMSGNEAIFKALSAAKGLKPHVPLIRFPKRGAPQTAMSMSSPSMKAAPAAAQAFGTVPIIEDWQLPVRFQRDPISQEEIDYINRGGPE